MCGMRLLRKLSPTVPVHIDHAGDHRYRMPGVGREHLQAEWDGHVVGSDRVRSIHPLRELPPAIRIAAAPATR